MKMIKSLLAASAISAFATQVQALPITYTFIGENVSGALAGASFTGQTLKVTLEGDTDNVIPATPGRPSFNTAKNPGLTGTFEISGVGNGIFANPIQVYKSTSVAGFGDTADIFWLVWGDAYDLTTEISVEGLSARRQNNTVNTDLGILNITAVTTGSFSASYPGAAEVPEPASIALLGLGVAGLGLSRARTRKAG